MTTFMIHSMLLFDVLFVLVSLHISLVKVNVFRNGQYICATFSKFTFAMPYVCAMFFLNDVYI